MMRAVRVVGPRFVLSLLLAALCGSCNKFVIVDGVMAGAYRPEPASTVDVSPYVLLAGDLHCHVSPPDSPGHVGRDLPATVLLAEEEGLDFVVLTPHIWDEFFAHPEEREIAAEEIRALARAIDETDTDVMFLAGFEYSTSHGHATFGFADLDRVLADVPLHVAAARPERFFERWVARGGVIVVNHPLLTGLDSIIPNARWDLSWEPWTRSVRPRRDIAVIHRLAHGWEAENSGVAHLRDWYLTGLPHSSRRAVLNQIDRRVRNERRRMTPTGGSDSHSHHLRAVTFVLSEERSERAVRDAIVAGRVCVRSPAACTFEVRVPGGRWQAIGASLTADGEVQVRARGEDVTVFRDGAAVARTAGGQAARVPVPSDRCSVLRAHVDGGDSAPVYVNCPFAG
jgi:hypothetical protein